MNRFEAVESHRSLAYEHLILGGYADQDRSSSNIRSGPDSDGRQIGISCLTSVDEPGKAALTSHKNICLPVHDENS